MGTGRVRKYMACYDIANLVTAAKMNTIDEIPCSNWTLRSTAVRIQHKVSGRAVKRIQLYSKSSADLHWGFSCSNIWLSFKSNFVPFWMYLQRCMCYQEQMRMLWQSLTAPSLAPGGHGSIWKDFRVLSSAPTVSGTFLCGFWSDRHVADDDGYI